MKNNQYQHLVLEILGNRPIAFNPVLARLTGSINAGLFLSYLLSCGNVDENDGWFSKTIEEFEEETALSREEQDGAIRRLKQLGIIEVKVMRIPAKRHFKLNLDKIINLRKNTYESK